MGRAGMLLSFYCPGDKACGWCGQYDDPLPIFKNCVSHDCIFCPISGCAITEYAELEFFEIANDNNMRQIKLDNMTRLNGEAGIIYNYADLNGKRIKYRLNGKIMLYCPVNKLATRKKWSKLVLP